MSAEERCETPVEACAHRAEPAIYAAAKMIEETPVHQMCAPDYESICVAIRLSKELVERILRYSR